MTSKGAESRVRRGRGVTVCLKVRVKIHKVMRIHMNFSKESAKNFGLYRVQAPNYGLYRVQDPNNHQNRPKRQPKY